jgi:hypothetical protein
LLNQMRNMKQEFIIERAYTLSQTLASAQALEEGQWNQQTGYLWSGIELGDLEDGWKETPRERLMRGRNVTRFRANLMKEPATANVCTKVGNLDRWHSAEIIDVPVGFQYWKLHI